MQLSKLGLSALLVFSLIGCSSDDGSGDVAGTAALGSFSVSLPMGQTSISENNSVTLSWSGAEPSANYQVSAYLSNDNALDSNDETIFRGRCGVGNSICQNGNYSTACTYKRNTSNNPILECLDFPQSLPKNLSTVLTSLPGDYYIILEVCGFLGLNETCVSKSAMLGFN